MPHSHNLAYPIRRFETATSYVSRLTRYCGLSSPNDLCLDQGFRWQDFIRGDDLLFDKVAGLGGACATSMKQWAIRTIDLHQFLVSGQRATKASLGRTRIRVCPRCLIEDCARDGPNGPFRRHHWHLYSIRSCLEHSVPLLTLPSEKFTIANYDFAGVVQKRWACVEKAVQAVECRVSTDFERYIFDRLTGRNQCQFLDSFPMFIATRLCEVMGYVLVFGPKRKISDASEHDLALAGQEGFELLKKGEAGFREGLEMLVTPRALQVVRHQSDMGALFEWLRSSKLGADFEPLKDMVRNFIFETYPLKEGDRVLGKPCPSPRQFSIHGAWQSLGIQRKRMNRYLVEEGFARKDGADQSVRLNGKLSADAVDEISERMNNRLNSFEAQDFLNVSAEMLQQFRDSGILTPMTDALDQVPKYERCELEKLLENLSARSQQRSPTADTAPIIDAARRVRCPASDILFLILAGKLAPTWHGNLDNGIEEFSVDLDELRAALPQLVMPGVTRGEASRLLRVTYPTINYLVAEGLLEVVYVRNPKSRQFVYAVTEASMASFNARYETLGQLAKRYRRASGPLGCHIEAKGVCPVETPNGISWFYERKGLDRRLRRLGLVAPIEEVAI